MAMNNELQIDQWMKARLDILRPAGPWQPNTITALAQLRARRSIPRRPRLRWMLTVAVAAAVCLWLMALPAPRVLAHHCLDCSVALWKSLSIQQAPMLMGKQLIPEKDRKMAPDFTRTDASGMPLKLSDFKGRVVLLNFWATWCGGCQVEIPWFAEFEKHYQVRGLRVVGVSMDDDGWKSVKPYLAEKKVNYAVVIGDDELRKLYTLDSMPMTLLIDRDGRIAASHVGLVSKLQYRTEIDGLLGK